MSSEEELRVTSSEFGEVQEFGAESSKIKHPRRLRLKAKPTTVVLWSQNKKALSVRSQVPKGGP